MLRTRLTRHLQQRHFLLVVGPTEQTARARNVLFAFLELPTAGHARKARQVVDVVQRAHHQLVRVYRLQAGGTLGRVQSVEQFGVRLVRELTSTD